MAAITAKSLVTRAGTLIQDATSVRWPITELLDWFNDGQREVVLLKPEASVANRAVLLAAGATKQTLPDGQGIYAGLPVGIILIRVVRNMGSAGTTPGNAIRIVDREVMDSQSPSWHADANTFDYIKHYMFDPLDPKTYYVYPKAPAAALYVDLVYSCSPANCTINGVTNNGALGTVDSVMSIDDIYANALLDYILYRAYSKDAEYAQNAQLALAHYTAFGNSITGKTGTDMAHNPNRLAGGANPNVPRTGA